MASTIPFSIRIDPEIKNLLDQEAEKADRSASYVAVEAIKKYLESKQHEREIIRAAMIKADKGEFISSDNVRTWFASLGSENELPRPKPNVFLKETKK